MAATLGADLVGMSTVIEAIAARHVGLEILGLSLATNLAAGISDVPLSGDDVTAAGDAAAERIGPAAAGDPGAPVTVDLARHERDRHHDGCRCTRSCRARTSCVDGGTITSVGPVAGDPPAAARVIDANGGLVMPGLVNAHTHLAMTMFRGLADDLDLDGFLGRLMPAEGAVLSEHGGAGTALAVAECLRAGITTALDMYFFPEAAAAVADADGVPAAERAGVRRVPRRRPPAVRRPHGMGA